MTFCRISKFEFLLIHIYKLTDLFYDGNNEGFKSDTIMNKEKNLRRKIEILDLKITRLLSKSEKNYLDEYYIEKYKKQIDYYGKILDIYKNFDKTSAKKELTLLREARRRDEILHGNLFSTIIMVCLPIALYVFFNSFYSLLDSVMCATISAGSVSDVAILAQIKNMVNAFGSGIAGGGAVLVSRYYGAGRMDKARHASGNCVAVSLIASAFICIVLIPLAGVICRASGCTGEDTGLYFSLQMFELAVVAINTIFIGLEKVKGNSKRILALNILVLIIKLSLNVIFIYLIKVDSIVWLEVSSIIAQCSLLAYALTTLFSERNALRIRPKDLKPKKKYISPILKLSIPIFLGKFVMNLGKFIVNLLSNIFYGEATQGLIVGALAVSNNLNGLITSPANAFEEGESTIVSQNIGAKNYKRTFDAFVRTSVIVLTFSMIGFILVRFVFLDDLANLFSVTRSSDIGEIQKGQLLVEYIKEVFVYDCLSIPTLGVTSCVLGLLYGYGKTALSTLLNFSRIATRILTLVILYNSGMNYTAVGVAMGISNIIIMLLSILFFVIFFIQENPLKKQENTPI